MEHPSISCGALLLAGGESRRMGRDKSRLFWREKTFTAIVAEAFSNFDEKLFSTGGGSPAPPGPQWKIIPDVYPHCGPLGGLHAGLTVCRSPYLMAAACDLPLLEGGLPRYLAGFTGEDVDAVVPVTPDGQPHPLCALYRKALAAQLEAQIQTGNFRMQDAVKACRTRYVPVTDAFARMLTNINTPEDYHALLTGGL